MYHHNQQYRAPQYESNDEYNMESDLEMENAYHNGEFNYESESNYELAPGFEIGNEMESDNEYAGNYETNDEYGQANEYSNYGEMEGESVYRDEMEAELEYVTNEDEFSNWVNEVVVRDHRNRNLRPTLSRPITQRAVRHLSTIASRTLPYLGIRKGGWRGANYRNYNSNRANWRRPGHYGRRYGGYRPWGSNSNFNAQQPYPDPNTFQQPAYSGADATAPQQTNDQDGSFKNFVLDTIINLSQQISAGNESLSALKNSITNSAANNFPSIVQPKTDAGGAPPDAQQPAGNTQEFEGDYEYNMEAEGEITDSESSFSEEAELELASDLLSIKNEMELDHFLGDLLKKAVGAVSGILSTGPGKLLKGVLKTVAQKALPLAGAAAGTYFGGPAGAALGEKLGKSAGSIFGLELEGLSNEDREFEVARAVVRFAGNAAKQVSENLSGNPSEDIRQAITESAMRFAPGLLLRRGHHHHHRHGYNGYGNNDANGGDNGTWHRRGNKIIIENI